MIGITQHQGYTSLSDWMDRPALNAYFTMLLIAVSDTDVDLTFAVFHKNREEPGSGSQLGNDELIDDSSGLPKVASINATGLKELVRLAVRVENGAGNTDWAHYLPLNPSAYELSH